MLDTSDLPITDKEFELFRSLVHEETGISLGETKRALLNSRLMGRLRHHGYETFAEYYEHLKHQDPHREELQHMINAVTTNMTSFFRENHHFDSLAKLVLQPARQMALQGRAPSLRIWSAGCSSGEEAYSIAITLAKNLEHLAAWDVKVLATDIDTKILDTARQGMYPRTTVASMAPDMLKQYFLRGTGPCEDMVKVKPEVRRLVTMGHLNLMSPWPFHSKFDAIFCRNVIIYFDHDSQKRLIDRFAQSLKPGGIFFAGHSENLFWVDDIFESLGHTTYRLRSPRKAAPDE